METIFPMLEVMPIPPKPRRHSMLLDAIRRGLHRKAHYNYVTERQKKAA